MKLPTDMRWKSLPKRVGLGWGDAHGLGRGARRWPLSYIFAILLFLILLPQICFKVMSQSKLFMESKSVFGDNLLPTPWHPGDQHINSTWERSLALLKCSYPRWSKPSRRVVPAQTGTHKCPSYFHWIQKDLSPWNFTGITPTNIEMAKEHAAFKVVILKGRLYVDLYYSCVETRLVFTVWGLLLLLEKYDGKIPDVEMMFDCMDRPLIEKTEEGSNEFWSPAPLFRYCSNSKHYDIPWPDWSFWGWSETKLDPWDEERGKIVKGSNKKAWIFKEPKAYWRGNPNVASPLRMELVQCNNATKTSRAEVHHQNWLTEGPDGYQDSRLENQCGHRYKIYAEGFAWSVSFKYILACGSPTLAITPAYYDFFMRGLKQGVHYIPVRPSKICASKLCAAIDYTVTVAERNLTEAFLIGKAGQDFANNEIGMPNVYDYMYHMLRAYAALQKFKPSIPRTATKVTQDFILCMAEPHEKRLLEKSREQLPWSTAPCQLPETPGVGFQDFRWEAKEHANQKWATERCDHRRKKSSKNGKNNGPAATMKNKSKKSQKIGKTDVPATTKNVAPSQQILQ